MYRFLEFMCGLSLNDATLRVYVINPREYYSLFQSSLSGNPEKAEEIIESIYGRTVAQALSKKCDEAFPFLSGTDKVTFK